VNSEGWLCWGDHWPPFTKLGHPAGEHPFLVTLVHPTGYCDALGITHSADLFDHCGSVVLKKENYDSIFHPKGPLRDQCVLGVSADRIFVALRLRFNGTVAEIAGSSRVIKTRGGVKMDNAQFLVLKKLIGHSIRLAKNPPEPRG